MRSREESRHKETREREVIRHTNMSSIPSSIDKDAKNEEEDSYASEILQRLDDLGVSIPPNTSPKTLRNHKHSPDGIYKDSAALSVRDWTFNQNDRRG